MNCSDLIFSDLKVTEGLAQSISATITASCTLYTKSNDEGNEIVETPQTGLDIFYQGVKVGRVIVPALTLQEGAHKKEFMWTYIPGKVGSRALTELIKHYYCSTSDQKITFKPSIPSTSPTSVLPTINFSDFYLRGKVHQMIKKITVHVGPQVIFKEVQIDLLIEKPVECDFEILSLNVEAKTGDGRMLANAKHDFRQSKPFVMKGSSPESSPSKAITAHLAMSHLQCLKYINDKNLTLNVFLTSGIMKIGEFKIEDMELTFENVPFEVRLPIFGWKITGFTVFGK